MTKVSILVSVYNGEKYLETCLNSLKNQTYKNIEVVCINDGSTDSTPNIIRRQMEQDDRIKLVEHYPNKGLAYALNEGLKACTGDIIAYLDSDDWFADDSIERLVTIFDNHEDADCVLLKCIYVYPDGRQEEYKGLKFDSIDGMTAFKESLTWNVHGIYAARCELYERCNFDATCKHFSNDNTTRIHYFMSRKVYSSDAPYFYFQNPDSITYQVSVRRMDYMRATESMKKQLKELGCPHDILSLYENERWKIVVDSYLFYFKNRTLLSKKEISYCLKELKRGLHNIDVSLLYKSLTKKLGYCPLGKYWSLFRIEEELYFWLKRITGRL
jgi:glycosyltransferase involved in cell wall biosynthesis